MFMPIKFTKVTYHYSKIKCVDSVTLNGDLKRLENFMSSNNLEILRKLRAKQENKRCIDCPNRNPDWCSVPLGIWICMDCSGKHRRLGTHLSFVRSPLYDTWNDEQTAFMKLGGNAKARAAFEKANVHNLSAVDKYSSVAVRNYKNKLKNAVKEELARNGGGSESTSTAKKSSRRDANEDDWDNDSNEDFNDAQEEEDLDRRMGRLSMGSSAEENEEEPQFEIKSMKTKSTVRIGVAGKSGITSTTTAKRLSSTTLRRSTSGSSAESPASTKKTSNKDASDRWNDWGNDWDKDEEEADDAGNDWDNDWESSAKKSSANKKSPRSSGESLVSKYGYQTRVTEKNFVRQTSQQMGGMGSSSDIAPSDNPFQGYGSRGGFAAAVPRKPKNTYVVDSLQDIQDIDDLKSYAQERGLQLAQVSKEYGELLKEKGIEYASDLSESVKNWWRSFSE